MWIQYIVFQIINIYSFLQVQIWVIIMLHLCCESVSFHCVSLFRCSFWTTVVTSPQQKLLRPHQTISSFVTNWFSFSSSGLDLKRSATSSAEKNWFSKLEKSCQLGWKVFGSPYHGQLQELLQPGAAENSPSGLSSTVSRQISMTGNIQYNN